MFVSIAYFITSSIAYCAAGVLGMFGVVSEPFVAELRFRLSVHCSLDFLRTFPEVFWVANERDRVRGREMENREKYWPIGNDESLLFEFKRKRRNKVCEQFSPAEL